MRRTSKAFTLVEILLVTSLIGLVSIAVLKSFNNGLKLWAKAQRINREAEAAIFLDKMSEDLRSMVFISSIAFKGSSQKISFPAIVITKADAKSSRAQEGVVDQIGAVQYRYDAELHKIFRRQANYAEAVKGKWVQDEIAIVSGIEDLSFHYEIFDDKGFLLKSEIGEGVPSGVMVDVRFSDDSGTHELKRYLPTLIGE
jgi:hypothetical protein